MANTFNIDPARRLVSVKLLGVLVGEELLSLDDRVRNDPLFDSDFDQLLDLGEVDPAQLKREDFFAIAQRPPAFSPKSRRAFVIPSGDLAFGLARMFEMMRDSPGNQIEFFTDVDNAKVWLGIDE